jgi:type I restriction-modification system DNA methylase subunit
MDTFENTLNGIRDILRKEGITGMDSIKHCLAFIIAKHLTDKTCKKLQINEKYTFENLMKTTDDRLYERFYKDGDVDCVIGQIYDKMKFSTDFKLESKTNLKNILNKLTDIDIEKLSSHFDIVGLIYELHLKSGTSQAMRDLGQYFTNRSVIEYMVKLCDPKIKKNGEIESILDPAMGTAGFLAMSIKHLNEKNKNKKINWNLNKNNVYGFDIDDNVKNMATLNLFLETGEIFDKTLTKRDTLHKDLLLDDNKTFIDGVDIILANEPFGIKGLKYADCCERIKKLKIDGTKAEPLFLQLMMQSLNKNGRCAVVVPDGVLFNGAKLHSETRKYLVENFNLKKVCSLDDGLFLNTGVKSSILFFVNDGKTKEVEFVKIKLDGETIVEENSFKVEIDKIIENSYSLFINKYNKVDEVKIKGLEYKKLGEICDFLPKSKRPASFGKDSGKYKFFTSSLISKYCDEADYKDEHIIIGDGGVANINIGQNFSCSDHNYILKSNQLNILNKYIYYYLFNNLHIIENGFKGSTMKNVSKTFILDIEIPIPSLSLQEQIVEALDAIYDTLEGNKKLIQNYEKIKNDIIWCCTINVDKKKIEEIGTIKGGKRLDKDESYSDNETNFHYVQVNDFDNINDEKYKYISENIYNRLINYKIDNNDILISIAGTIGRIALYKSIKKSILTENAVKLVNVNINNLYLYNILKSREIQNKFQNSYKQATIAKLSLDTIRNTSIPIPSKETQEYIVKECEYYDNLIDTLKKENDRLSNNKIIELALKSISALKKENNDLEEVEYDGNTYYVKDDVVYKKKSNGKVGKEVGTINKNKEVKLNHIEI